MLNKQGSGKIDYVDYSWNPVSGCKHGCSYCYLKRMERFGFDMTPAFHPKRLQEPMKIKKPSKFLVCSSGDLFGKWVPDKWIWEVFEIIRACPQHTFLLLTKNPSRYRCFDFPQNCWVGTTVDGTEKTIANAHGLVNALTNNGSHPCTNLAFVSFEPLLEDVWEKYSCLNGELLFEHLDWIIIGADSNRGAKKPEQKWADKLIDQAEKYGTRVWVKDNFKYPHLFKEFPE